MKRFVSLLLVLLMLTSVFAGCASSVTDTSSHSSDSSDGVGDSDPAESKGKLIINSEGTEFVVIVPSGVTAIYSAVSDIRGHIYEKVSKNLFVKYDASTDEQECEILVGATNRAESSEVSEGLAREEFRVKWVGNKLVIGAGSNFSAKAGFEWLYENYIKTAGSDGIFVPENIDHKGSVDMNTSF